MKPWQKPQLLFKAKKPDLGEFIGRTVRIPECVMLDGKPAVLSETVVKIEKIVGNKPRPTFYEINGEHLIGMLRFHAQMCGDKSITEQQFLDFENMNIEAEKLPEKEKKLS